MAINGLLNQEVTVERESTTVGKHGETSFAASATYRARFQKMNKTIMGVNGELEPIHGIVFLPADANVDIGARLIYDEEPYRIVGLEAVVLGSGNVHHYEAQVQSWSFAS